ncbi:MAG: HAD family phosphatase [Lachnospiraceae bacterium]|nr:HAD family phosphatase [Lachnospiraceae bacterium]
MIKAVVFDMDGVIFDSEKLYRKHWMISAKEYGLDEKIMKTLLDKIAGATKERNEKLMKDHFGQDFDYMAFRESTMNRMDKDIDENGVELKPGVRELLNYLKGHGYMIGLATSTVKERAERNLKRAGLISYFDGIMYGGIVTNGKPAPDIYEHACQLLGVPVSEAIGVEDSINGIISSHAAGLYTIMVVDLIQPNDEVRAIADQIYDSLFEVKELLESGTL